jgi:hypothetical protein
LLGAKARQEITLKPKNDLAVFALASVRSWLSRREGDGGGGSNGESGGNDKLLHLKFSRLTV